MGHDCTDCIHKNVCRILPQVKNLINVWLLDVASTPKAFDRTNTDVLTAVAMNCKEYKSA